MVTTAQRVLASLHTWVGLELATGKRRCTVVNVKAGGPAFVSGLVKVVTCLHAFSAAHACHSRFAENV